MNAMEKRLQALEQQTGLMQKRLTQLEAQAEISSLMGRYAVYYGAGCGRQIMEELWSQSEDIRFEYGASGVFQRRWQILTYYVNEAYPGRLNTLSFSSPAIVVAEDGQSAKGSWTAFGTETDAGDLGPEPVMDISNRRALFSSRTKDGRQYRAEVLLQRYEVDFIRETSQWKILHLHVIEYFRCPYDRDWVRYAEERFATDGIWLESLFTTPDPLPEDSHGENLPSLATTSHWQYTLDCRPGQIPDFLQSAPQRRSFP